MIITNSDINIAFMLKINVKIGLDAKRRIFGDDSCLKNKNDFIVMFVANMQIYGYSEFYNFIIYSSFLLNC